jgi:pimeloyl-ACP methyl ester carboxylesterase
MAFRGLAAALCALLLSACATTYSDLSQARSPCRMEPGGWCAFLRDAAVEAWPFAVAATNAYSGDNDVFGRIGPQLEPLARLPIAEDDAKRGFGYEIFAQYAPGSGDDVGRKPIARVLAFRGTDAKGGFTDFYNGTLHTYQVEMAVRYFDAERARWGGDLPWIVTGHSLGGVLATEISVRNPDVRGYMFNTSPIYYGDTAINAGQRVVFNERGEVLRQFARYDVDPAANVFTVNCRPQAGALAKHKVRPLADCITWIAAYASPDAHEVVKANAIAKPLVECGLEDQAHPGPSPRMAEPCLHVDRRNDKPKAKRSGD